MTQRERALARLERRREWAAGRAAKARQIDASRPAYADDWAFITQPGHIPARARLIAREEKAQEHRNMATHHTEKAASIESRLERTVFSDDTDAIEQLQAKIDKATAERRSL